jgi:hypothetical protein
MQRWVVVFLALGACVDVPPFVSNFNVTWRDAAGGGTMTSGSSSTTTAPFAQLTLAGGDGFHFPSELKVLGTQILGHTSNVSCGFEDRGGVAVYPGPRFSPDSTIMNINANQVNPTLQGPAAATAILQWGGEFSCSDGHNHDPGGYSIFTMFPDGRIIRYDEVNESDTAPASSAMCDCGSQPQSGTFVVSTFWTFDHGQFDSVVGTDGVQAGVAVAIPNHSQMLGFSHQYGCIENASAGTSVDVAWIGSSAVQSPPYDRIDGPGNDDTTFAMVHDFDHPADISMLSPVDHHGMTSLSFHTDGPCGAAADGAAQDFIDQLPITVDGRPAPMGHDGIYGGYTLGQDTSGVEISDRSFAIQGPTRSAFAVWMRFDFDVVSLSISKGEAQSGTWFVPQKFADNAWIVWFRDALPTGQTIQIEVR